MAENFQGKLLPHEVTRLQARLADFSRTQAELSDHKNEAVSEGGDGWHDNAAFDAVVADSRAVAAQGRWLSQLLGKSEVVDYPDPDSDTVAIGSRVSLDMMQDLVRVDLVGAIEAYPDDLDGIDNMRTSPGSPLGAALLNRAEGDDVTYEVGDARRLTVNIREIDQNAIREEYGGVEEIGDVGDL